MPPSAEDAPDLSGLIELSRVEHIDLKPVILRVQADLFLQAAARDRAAVEAFEALACGLIPTVDEDTALIVAQKLAPCPETPQAVLARLAERGGPVRDAVVALTPNLSETLLAAAHRDGTPLEGALARRTDLGRSAQAALTAEGDVSIDLTLARNAGLALASDTAESLVARARGNAELARALLARTDLPAATLAPLFLLADAERRAGIVQAVEAVAALRPTAPAPRDLGRVLTQFSAARDVTGFVGALAEALGLPTGFLRAAPDAGTRYDLLTLALRAAGLDEEEAVYVFLTLNETVARSAGRVFDLVKLFRTTSRPAARDLVSAICDRPVSERPARPETHRPYHAPEAKPRQPERAAPARPALPGRLRQPAS